MTTTFDIQIPKLPAIQYTIHKHILCFNIPFPSGRRRLRIYRNMAVRAGFTGRRRVVKEVSIHKVSLAL